MAMNNTRIDKFLTQEQDYSVMTVKTQKRVKNLALYIWGGLAPQAPDTHRLCLRLA